MKMLKHLDFCIKSTRVSERKRASDTPGRHNFISPESLTDCSLIKGTVVAWLPLEVLLVPTLRLLCPPEVFHESREVDGFVVKVFGSEVGLNRPKLGMSANSSLKTSRSLTSVRH